MKANIPDHPYRIFIMRAPDQEYNAFVNLISHESDIDKIFLYAKDPYDTKYQFLVKKREDVGIKHLNDPKAFI